MGIVHTLNLYQSPRQGGMDGRFLYAFNARNYRHRIKARGGFDSASASLFVSKAQARELFANGLGCVVRVVTDNPSEPVWEGFINRVTWAVGARSLTTSFDAMMNRVAVNYWQKTTPTVPASAGQIGRVSATATLRSQDSIARFGTKDGAIEGHVQWNTDTTHKQALADKLLAERAYPQTSLADGQGEALIEVEMLGLAYFALDWVEYNERDAGDDTAIDLASAFVNATIANRNGPNAQYVYKTFPAFTVAEARRFVATIAPGINLNLFDSSSGTNYQFVERLVEAGYNNVPYTWGVTLFDVNERARYVYWQPANTSVKYLVNALSDSGRVLNLSGREVRGDLVKPDGAFKINDLLLGAPANGDDPNSGYIESVDYDGETGRVVLNSADNIQVQGIIGADRFYHQPGRRLKNAKPRQVV